MIIADTLILRSEEVAFRELNAIAQDNNLRVFAKVRLSDVLLKSGERLSSREFDFYTRSHCDFVVTDAKFRPILIVEYDGRFHLDARQQERDAIKNQLCSSAGMGLLRIHDRHVTKLYRGMTVLRWIVEVLELQETFYELQAEGRISEDEPFDAASFDFALNTVSSKRRFPYWLSLPATQSIHRLFKTADKTLPCGWHSFVGHDSAHTVCRLSSLQFDKNIIWAQTAIRRQDVDFPHFDLLSELNTCELGLTLEKFLKGELRSSSEAEFRAVFKRYCERYDVHPSHSMGSFPVEFSWSPYRMRILD